VMHRAGKVTVQRRNEERPDKFSLGATLHLAQPAPMWPKNNQEKYSCQEKILIELGCLRWISPHLERDDAVLNPKLGPYN
jgi:hypothetical protein